MVIAKLTMTRKDPGVPWLHTVRIQLGQVNHRTLRRLGRLHEVEWNLQPAYRCSYPALANADGMAIGCPH